MCENCKCNDDGRMTSKNYVENVIRTESEVTDALIERLTKPELVRLLPDVMAQCIDESTEIDALKKHIFYGKPLYLPHGEDDAYDIPQEIIDRLSNPKTIRLLHGTIGLVTEAGELLSMLYNHIFEGENLDFPNALEEVGDSQWYNGIIIDAIGTTFDEVLTVNINKLKARYPNKFNEKDAIERNLDVERSILENGKLED